MTQIILSFICSSSIDSLLASCNADCNCTSTIFEPVCGADGLTYFSPCRASCDKYYPNGNDNVRNYQNMNIKSGILFVKYKNYLYRVAMCIFASDVIVCMCALSLFNIFTKTISSFQLPLFENCSCVLEGLQDNMTGLVNATAMSGRCSSDCQTLPLFLVFIGLFLLLIFTLKIPTVIVTIR